MLGRSLFHPFVRFAQDAPPASFSLFCCGAFFVHALIDECLNFDDLVANFPCSCGVWSEFFYEFFVCAFALVEWNL
jgi:hypothetical protein